MISIEQPLMELRRVTHSYEIENAKTYPLYQLDGEIKSGEFLVIMGPSGTGKSTLFRLLCRLEDPEEGMIYFHNRPLQEWDPILLRRKIHYVYQTPVLFLHTVADNLSYPLVLQGKKVSEEKMLQLLEKVGLDPSFLQRPIDQLSGGEKQRVSLARSLTLEPEILLLDEPTSSLDPDTSAIIEDTISQYHKEGHTVLWITHRPDQGQKLGDRIWILENGKIKEEMPI